VEKIGEWRREGGRREKANQDMVQKWEILLVTLVGRACRRHRSFLVSGVDQVKAPHTNQRVIPGLTTRRIHEYLY